jgi:hypothetical protein
VVGVVDCVAVAESSDDVAVSSVVVVSSADVVSSDDVDVCVTWFWVAADASTGSSPAETRQARTAKNSAKHTPVVVMSRRQLSSQVVMRLSFLRHP